MTGMKFDVKFTCLFFQRGVVTTAPEQGAQCGSAQEAQAATCIFTAPPSELMQPRPKDPCCPVSSGLFLINTYGKHWVLSTQNAGWREGRANATLHSCTLSRHWTPTNLSSSPDRWRCFPAATLLRHRCPGAPPTCTHLQEEHLLPHCASCAGKIIRNGVFTECSADNRQTLAKVWRLNSNFLTAQISSLFYPDFNRNNLNMLTTACVFQDNVTANF